MLINLYICSDRDEAASTVINKKTFTTETQSTQSSEYSFIKNYLLRALCGSAVRSLQHGRPDFVVSVVAGMPDYAPVFLRDAT